VSKLSIAVPVGGKSSRLGPDRSFVELAGKGLIEHVLIRISELDQDETFIVTNNPTAYGHLGLPLIADVD